MQKLSPVVLFTYNRPEETRKTIKALQSNFLATKSDLFVFSDGPKDACDNEKVTAVRECLKGLNGFKNVKITNYEENNGLANSVINGVSEIIEQYGKIIVLEDDLVTSPNFLDFMNQALNFYAASPKIFSISGYTLDLPGLAEHNQDFYLGKRASSWGWGTWVDKWQNVDWEVSDYDEFRRNFKKRIDFFSIGSDMPSMLKNQMTGKIDSWAIRWCYHQFKYDLKTIFAAKSKIHHIGTSEEATHAAGATRYDTPLDTEGARKFKFVENPIENKRLIQEFRSKFSIMVRARAKLKKHLGFD